VWLITLPYFSLLRFFVNDCHVVDILKSIISPTRSGWILRDTALFRRVSVHLPAGTRRKNRGRWKQYSGPEIHRNGNESFTASSEEGKHQETQRIRPENPRNRSETRRILLEIHRKRRNPEELISAAKENQRESSKNLFSKRIKHRS
jgi:hypothetical protein